jgi:hypothetical protein
MARKIIFVYRQTWVDDQLIYHRKRTLVKEVSNDDYFDIIMGRKDLEYKCGRIQLNINALLFGNNGYFDKKLNARVLPECERVLKVKKATAEPSRSEQEVLDELYAYDENEPWWNR